MQIKTIFVVGAGTMGNGIAQVAILVPDLEEAVDNYYKLFGIDDWHFYTYGKPLIKKLNTGQWAAIFGNGYSSTSGTSRL